MGKIDIDRAEGTSSGDASGNPSAVFCTDPSFVPTLRRLSERGFSDAVSGEAGFLVSNVSYRHLGPYLSAVEHNHGGDRPTLQEVHNVLTFDRRYQSILFKYIGIFESKLRTQYARRMEDAHGAFALYDESLFLRRDRYERSMDFYSSEVRRQATKSRAVRRSLDEHDGRIPVSHGVECATLGTLSQLYSNTADQCVTAGVASSFGCSKSELSSWAKTITDVRNVCAHFDCYAVRRQIPSAPLRIRGIEDADNRGTFYVVLLLLRLMDPDVPFPDANLDYTARLRSDVESSVSAFAQVHPYLVEALGFRGTWREQMRLASLLFGE